MCQQQMAHTSDAVVASVVAALVLIPDMRRKVADAIADVWFASQQLVRHAEVPFSPDVEAALLAVGSVLFYVSRIRLLRGGGTPQQQTLGWASLGLGILFGLLVDPHAGAN